MAHTDAQRLLEDAARELQSGNLPGGIQLLDRVLALDPGNAAALDLSARTDLATGRADQALVKAQKAVGLQSIAPYVLTLAEALKAQGNHQLAGKYFTKVLAKLPREPRALLGLGEIYEQAGYRRLAIKAYRSLLDIQPKNLAVAIKYSNLLPIPELTEGWARVEAARPTPDASAQTHLTYYNHAVVYKEWAERARRNLMPYHATRLDEMFFSYAAAERDVYEATADRVLGIDAANKAALTAKAIALFSRGRRTDAEPYFFEVAKSRADTVYENIVFAPPFYRSLEALADADLERGLPPLVEVQRAAFDGAHVIYLSCNYGYFVDFARTMLLSIDATAPGAQIHLHIMDGSDEEWAKVKAFCAGLTQTRIAISAERPGVDQLGTMAARCYYHAIRFIRLHHHLAVYGKTLWLMDVDALMHRDPAPMFAAMGAADAAFRARPGRWEPWNQFNASVMAIAPTERGRLYLRLIAAYIAHFQAQGTLRWGIDQLAMYAVHEFLKDEGRAPTVHLLDDRAVDYECYDDGYVWCNSGRGKFIQLKLLEKGVDTSIDPDRAKYFDALKRYAGRLA